MGIKPRPLVWLSSTFQLSHGDTLMPNLTTTELGQSKDLFCFVIWQSERRPRILFLYFIADDFFHLDETWRQRCVKGKGSGTENAI